MGANRSQILLDAVTATGKSKATQPHGAKHTFQAHGITSAGAGAATLKVYGSNVLAPTRGATGLPTVDGEWKLLGTITLTLGTTRTGDAFAVDAPYLWFHVDLTAISGTDATVTAAMGS